MSYHFPESFHKSLGKVLVELHSIPSDKAIEHGLEVQTPEEARMSMKNCMDAVKAKYGVGEHLWNRWQAWIEDDEMWPKNTGLITSYMKSPHST